MAIFAKGESTRPALPSPGVRKSRSAVCSEAGTRGVLPTGAGKSLIYQLAGLLIPGCTLVIHPIVALIDDQIDGLARQGIDRAIGISSADTTAGIADAKLQAVEAGDALFCFVSPERLQHERSAMRFGR